MIDLIKLEVCSNLPFHTNFINLSLSSPGQVGLCIIGLLFWFRLIGFLVSVLLIPSLNFYHLLLLHLDYSCFFQDIGVHY